MEPINHYCKNEVTRLDTAVLTRIKYSTADCRTDDYGLLEFVSIEVKEDL